MTSARTLRGRRHAERVAYRVEGIVEFLATRVERARAAGIREVIVEDGLKNSNKSVS